MITNKEFIDEWDKSKDKIKTIDLDSGDVLYVTGYSDSYGEIVFDYKNFIIGIVSLMHIKRVRGYDDNR